MAAHPADGLLKWLHPVDFGVLAHKWAEHGRDYLIEVQDCLGADRGTHELTFTHCVRADLVTRVRDDVWPESWGDEFTDYKQWEAAGEPSGYIWGTNWSMAYPGITVVRDSAEAADYTRRFGQPMFELVLETDRFHLRLVFHSIRSRKLSDAATPTASCIVPLAAKKPDVPTEAVPAAGFHELVEGADQVESVLGSQPTFHGAEILALTVERDPADADERAAILFTIRVAPHITKTTCYPLRQSLVTFKLHDVEMGRPNELMRQRVLDELRFSREEGALHPAAPIYVKLAGTGWDPAILRCGRAEVLSIERLLTEDDAP